MVRFFEGDFAVPLIAFGTSIKPFRSLRILLSPFVALSAGLVVAAKKLYKRRVAVSFRVVGIELQSFVVGGDSNFLVAFFLEDIAKFVVSIWVVGLESQSFVVGGDSNFLVAFSLEDIAKVVVSLWVVGLELKSLLEEFYRLIKSSLDPADCREISIGNVIVCASGNQVFVNRFCFLELSLVE